MHPRLIRLSVTTAIAALAAVAVAAPAAAAGSAPGRAHAMGKYNPQAKPGGTSFRTSNMTYHGGPVETMPAVYITYWGTWTGATAAQTYMNGFFGNVGGSSWENIVTQYCQGVAVGTVNCGSAGAHIHNLTGQLAGVWNDTSSPPANGYSDASVQTEAQKAVGHFGYNANATYFVFTPSGDSESGFAANGGQWCAYHGVTNTGSGEAAYAYMPYMPDAGASCGQNFVNAGAAGLFDGFSIVGGHEYAEAETDPHTQSGQYGWYDRNGNENGDKCAWSPKSTDITLGGVSYAVQPTWSNANNGCVTSY